MAVFMRDLAVQSMAQQKQSALLFCVFVIFQAVALCLLHRQGQQTAWLTHFVAQSGGLPACRHGRAKH